MNYRPAELDGQALARLQQLEAELRQLTSDNNIVIVAYQGSAERFEAQGE
ncbi:hypothetical protein [Paenibacillus albus]|nr:hypothetical protein [Paenibacillus albus]